MFAQRKEGFPLGGKLSRKRLMRGDKFALTQGFRSPYAHCSSNGREAALCKAFAPPNPNQKLPHKTPAITKSETKSSLM